MKMISWGDYVRGDAKSLGVGLFDFGLGLGF